MRLTATCAADGRYRAADAGGIYAIENDLSNSCVRSKAIAQIFD
jgi:hypothetical protein